MRGEAPSAGVNMLALSVPLKSADCAVDRVSGSLGS
jgi:hypothetical protein